MKALLTVKQVARALNVKIKTVRKWIYLGKLQIVKVGRTVRIRPEVVQTLIQRGTRKDELGLAVLNDTAGLRSADVAPSEQRARGRK